MAIGFKARGQSPVRYSHRLLAPFFAVVEAGRPEGRKDLCAPRGIWNSASLAGLSLEYRSMMGALDRVSDLVARFVPESSAPAFSTAGKSLRWGSIDFQPRVTCGSPVRWSWIPGRPLLQAGLEYATKEVRSREAASFSARRLRR